MGYVRDRWRMPGPDGGKVRDPERWGKGKRWQAVWTQDGVRHAQTFTTKDGATHYLAQIETGHFPIDAGDSITFKEAWDRWKDASVHHKKSTQDSVNQTSKTMILPEIGDMDLKDLNRANLQQLVNVWIDKGYYPSRIQVAWSYVTGPLKLAVVDGLLVKTPSLGVKLPKRVKERVIPLTEDQVKVIAGNVPQWFHAMVLLGAASGLRQSELTGLTWDRVTPDGLIIVDRQLIDVDCREPVFGPPKTPASNRKVRVPLSVMDTLAAHRKKYPSPDSGLVFQSRYKTPITRGSAGDAWRNATREMGLKPRSGWHELRHFHASLLIAAGLSVVAVADRLGHDDPTETLQTYSHLWPTDDGRIVDAVESMITNLQSSEK